MSREMWRRELSIWIVAAAVGCDGSGHSVDPHGPAERRVRLRPIDRMETVYVPPGAFDMGTGGLSWLRFTGNLFEGTLALHPLKNESPHHSVHLDGFWIDRTEVTVSRFRRFVQQTGYQTTAEREGWGKPWRDGPQAEEWPRTEGITCLPFAMECN